jgi:thiosulfate/3-mercaptopyruvate sulfurtransferase
MPNSPLIEADELHGLIGAEHVRIADVRWYLNRPGAGRTAYAEGHIPTAVFVDLDADLADHNGLGAPGRHPLPSPDRFAARIGELGFASDDLIVAYDDIGGSVAARLWWMLDNLGHRGGAAVLNGGLQAWLAAGYDLSAGEVALPPGRMKLDATWTNVIERSDLADKLGALTFSTPGRRNAIEARSNRSIRSQATFPPPSTRRLLPTSTQPAE